jgi:hypothetical protein
MRRIFIDPDGTGTQYLGVIVSHPTGVVYSQQCGCTNTFIREQEGYYVPIYIFENNKVGNQKIISELYNIFHENSFTPLDKETINNIEKIVNKIPWWENENKMVLKLDWIRTMELTEAWIPILIPDGSGILIWPNCD